MLQLAANKLILKLLFVYLGVLGLPLNDSTAQAYSLNVDGELNDSSLVAQGDDDFDFAGDGRSGHRNGGGSRSECSSVDVPLTALMPRSNFGTAIATRPQFWLYVPYTSEQVPVGEFILQDADRNDIYRSHVMLPDTPGFTSVTLPATAPELTLNQAYRWYFNLYCELHQESSPIFVQGWVQRISVSPSLEAQLADIPERVDLVYARNRVWFDAIASLAESRMANPTDSKLIADWHALLNTTGVELELPDSAAFAGPVTLIEATPN